MPPQEPAKSNKNLIALIVLFVALLVIAYLILTAGKSKDDTGPQEPQITKENVKFEEVNLVTAQTSTDKLPKGFPNDIPLETKDIFVSDTKVYTDRTPNVTLYTVNYRTAKTVSAKYNEYLDYMTKAGYTFGENGKDEKNHSLYGTKGADSLLVVASTQEDKTVVQVVYTKVGN